MFLLGLAMVTGQQIWSVSNVTNCTRDVNYDIPITDIFCDDGDCWSYCDHIKWHESQFNETFVINTHQEQYECLQTGCTNLYYERQDISVLEKCAMYKCHVPPNKIENVRPCSILMLKASVLYRLLHDKKQNMNELNNVNRSIIEYSKQRYISELKSIITAEEIIIWDLEQVVQQIVGIVSILDPSRELAMINMASEALVKNAVESEQFKNRMITANDISTELRTRLNSLISREKWSETISGGLVIIRQYMDTLASDIMRQYVYGNTTCISFDDMIIDIEEQCVLCGENGDCQFNGEVHTCSCHPGWKNAYCSELKTTCVDNPCLFEGQCVDEYGKYRCECPSDKTGKWCHVDIDESLGCNATVNPCQNGQCRNESFGYTCDCPVSFSGRNCQYALTDCVGHNPCDNGDCVFDGTRLHCECHRDTVFNQPFWYGDACSFKQIECDYNKLEFDYKVVVNGHPCHNNGVCTLNVDSGGFDCFCESGYFGKRCESWWDEQNLCIMYGVPCIHGNCQDCVDAASCVCKCDPGYKGEQCSVEKDLCQFNPCNHSANCVNRADEFYCDCSTVAGHFGGTLCDTVVSCAQKPCGDHFISCNDESTSLSGINCLCEPGYMGERCEIDARHCNDHVCLNGGNCAIGHSYPFCICPDGWSGNRCQYSPTFCDQNPCGSYGSCYIVSNGYKCSCEDGWEGNDCNHNIDECLPHPCKHGACNDKINGYDCLCEEGWRGEHCNILRSPCDDVTCSNHGQCTDTRLEDWSTSDYECLCAARSCKPTVLSLRNHRTATRSITFWPGLVGGLSVLIIGAFCVYKKSTKRTKRRFTQPLRTLTPLNTI